MIFLVFVFLGFSIGPTFSSDLDWDSVSIENHSNQTFILHFNLTTNDSYYITFRLFEQEQYKYGLFIPNSSTESRSIEINYRYNSFDQIFFLFIVCFHFLRFQGDIDIQCKDLRLAADSMNYSDNHYHPSYKPLFVPLMYALSVLMLLPVIVQHRRRKMSDKAHREQQLKRISVGLTDETQTSDSKTLPVSIELASFPSSKNFFESLDENEKITFQLQEPMFSDGFEFEMSTVTADDCVAHLLNSTPWTQSTSDFQHDYNHTNRWIARPERNQFRRSSTKNDGYCTVPLFRSNPAFIESDV